MILLENDRCSNQILPHLKYSIPVTQYRKYKDMNCIRDGLVLNVKLHIQVKFKENILDKHTLEEDLDEKRVEAFNEVFKDLGYYFIEYPYYITYITKDSINYILDRNFNKYEFLKRWMTSNIYKNESNIVVLPPNVYDAYFYNRYSDSLSKEGKHTLKEYFEELAMDKSIVYIAYPETTYVKEL